MKGTGTAQRKSEYDLEPLEPRLLLSASPLLPQAAALASAQPETQIAVQSVETGQQASFDMQASFTYNPAANLSELLPTVGAGSSGTPNAPAAPARAGAAAARASLEQPVPTNNGLTVNAGASASPSHAQSSMTDQMTETLNAAQPPPAPALQTMTYTAGPQGSDLTLRLTASEPGVLELVDSGSGAVVASSPLANVNSVQVTGANNANNTLTVDMSLPFWLKGGISFDGGSGGYNTLAVVGPKGGRVDYTAIGTGSGAMVVSLGGNSTSIAFTGLAPVDISGDVAYTFTPASASPANNGQTLDPTAAVDLTVGSSAAQTNVLTGSIGGVAFEKVNLLDVSSLTIDLSGGTTASPDTVTIDSSGFLAKDLQNVDIITGGGSNSISIQGASLALPVAGGSFVVDGGTGSTTLVVAGTYGSAAVTAGGAASGTLSLDGSSLSFTNVQTMQVPAAVASFTYQGSTVQLTGISSQVVDGGTVQLQVTGAGQTVQLGDPSTALTVDGSSVEITGSFGLAGADLSISAPTITVDAAAAIGSTTSAVGSVTLTATASDGAAVTDPAALQDQAAAITIDGSVDATGNVNATATVDRSVNISDSSGLDLSLSSTSSAGVTLDSGASVTGSSITLEAVTQGSVAGAAAGAVTVDFTESSTTDVTGATLTAGSIQISAGSSIVYSAVGLSAENVVPGSSTVSIAGSTLTASAGGVSVSALDSVSVSAVAAPQSFDMGILSTSKSLGVSLAENQLNRSVSAEVSGSTVSATDGDVSLSATRDDIASAVAHTVTLTGSAPPGTSTLSLGGTFSANLLLGDVTASISTSTVTTNGTGSLLIDAKDSSAVDAHADLSATGANGTPTSDTTGIAAGPSVAFNALGWTFGGTTGNAFAGFALETINTLLGTQIGDSPQPVTSQASISDSSVSAAGSVSVTAESQPQLNATVSNAAASTSSALYGASGSSASGILASNRVASQAEAFIDNSGAATGVTVSAGAGVTVSATDTSGIYSNSKVVSSSITTSDGGAAVLGQAVSQLTPATYDTTPDPGLATELRSLQFGDTVRVDQGYTGGGTPGTVYEYMGTAASGVNLDLASTNYADLGFWKPLPQTQLIPQGNSISPSSSLAVGGLVVINEVKAGAAAYINNATVTAATGDIDVTAAENAAIKATADSSASSSGGSAYGSNDSLAVDGTIATNVILSSASAYAAGSSLTATTGNIDVAATDSAAINATTKQATTTNATGVSVILAFNTVGWDAQNVLYDTLDALLGTQIGTKDPDVTTAYISDSSVSAGGTLTVKALSEGNISSSIGNDATAATTALFGASAASYAGILSSNMVATSAEASIDNTGAAAGTTVSAGGDVTVSAKDSPIISARSNLLDAASAANDGGAGILNSLAQSLIEDYQYTSNSGSQQLAFGDLVRVANGYSGGGTGGSVYEYMGTPGPVNLGTEDYGDYGLWKQLNTTNIIPPAIAKTALKAAGLGGGSATAMGGLVDRNDVRGAASASITAATVTTTAGTIAVKAIESAMISAVDSSVVSASQSTAGVIVTNMVLSSAAASVSGSSITDSADTTKNPGTGGVSVDAEDDSSINATATTSVKGAKQVIGFVVAFNTVGWQAQDLLSSTVDALIGDPALANVFGGEQPAAVSASIEDSSVTASGDVAVTATSAAGINATVSDSATSKATNNFAIGAKYGTNGMSAGALLASNKVASSANAYIDTATGTTTVNASGGVTVSATDRNRITSSSTVLVFSATTNDLSALQQLAGTLAPSSYTYTTASGTQTLSPGDIVMYSGSHATGGNGSEASLYQYVGPGASLDLGSQSYDTDTADWMKLSSTDLESLLFPNIGNLTDSNSRAYGGLVVYNDVRGQVSAYIVDATVTASADAGISALEQAMIQATATSDISSNGGSAFGSGDSIADNGQIVTNVVLASAEAYVTDSSVTSIDGSVLVSAESSSGIDATLDSSSVAGGSTASITLAFNSIGWLPQNILFNAIDALLGDPADIQRIRRLAARGCAGVHHGFNGEGRHRREGHGAGRHPGERHGKQCGEYHRIGPVRQLGQGTWRGARQQQGQRLRQGFHRGPERRGWNRNQRHCRRRRHRGRGRQHGDFRQLQDRFLHHHHGRRRRVGDPGGDQRPDSRRLHHFLGNGAGVACLRRHGPSGKRLLRQRHGRDGVRVHGHRRNRREPGPERAGLHGPRVLEACSPDGAHSPGFERGLLGRHGRGRDSSPERRAGQRNRVRGPGHGDGGPGAHRQGPGERDHHRDGGFNGQCLGRQRVWRRQVLCIERHHRYQPRALRRRGERHQQHAHHHVGQRGRRKREHLPHHRCHGQRHHEQRHRGGHYPCFQHGRLEVGELPLQHGRCTAGGPRHCRGF